MNFDSWLITVYKSFICYGTLHYLIPSSWLCSCSFLTDSICLYLCLLLLFFIRFFSILILLFCLHSPFVLWPQKDVHNKWFKCI